MTYIITPQYLLNLLAELQIYACSDPEGGTGGPDPPPPLKNHKYVGFLSDTAADPLKITKLHVHVPSQHSMLGHHRPASETPFNIIGPPAKRHLNGVSGR